MYGSMAKSSNTMIFSDRPADVNALMAQAAAVFKAVNHTTTSTSTNYDKKPFDTSNL